MSKLANPVGDLLTHEDVRAATHADDRMWTAYAVGCHDGWERAIQLLRDTADGTAGPAPATAPDSDSSA